MMKNFSQESSPGTLKYEEVVLHHIHTNGSSVKPGEI